MLERLAADQDKNSREQRQHAGDDANANAGESKDSHRNKINREQKHADVSCNVHAESIRECARAWQSRRRRINQ